MSDARFGSWSASESQVSVEYSLVVIEEIRHEVSEGFQRLSRGGVEVGGVLYGTREGRTIRILAMRPIHCEHARGPAFLLSDSDRQTLEDQLKHELEDPRLQDMICLGWFCSHTRSGILLSEQDQEIFEAYFAAPWQVTLVVRPGRGGAMRAGFFVREADGTVRSSESYLEFNFPDRLAGVLDRPSRSERPTVSRGHTVYFRESGASPARRESPAPIAPAPATAATTTGPQLLPAPPPRSKWPWLALWGAVVLVALVVGLRYFVLRPHVEPLALAATERGGKLQIAWNPKVPVIASAAHGTLTVTDGQAPRTYELTPQDLSRGNFSYQRNSEDVEIRLAVESSSGSKTEEATTFLGGSPSKPSSDQQLVTAQQQIADLTAENERLKTENAQQADQIQQLERNLKVLQARLGIQ